MLRGHRTDWGQIRDWRQTPWFPAPHSGDAHAQLTDRDTGPEEGALHAIRRDRNRGEVPARGSVFAHLAVPCP